ncbi:MAG TPA: imidazoleglycerol-phosphate dehydratase, partial [Nitrososphaeraceae archaeon]|nr:imidazoleglycerol-phosphate dehydratase [Nitrososphaeraceae archaeon]
REDLEHFIESLLQNLNACTHINIQYGENDHHKIEAAIKSFAIAFRMASNIDYQRNDIPSTKGVM